MKKFVLLILTFIILLISCALNISRAYDKDSTLYYDGRKKELVYFNVNNNDLFSNFKDLMPGDKRSQTIMIQVQNITSSVDLYLKSADKYNDYLDIKLYKDNDLVYDFSKDNDSKKIHTFYNDEKISLKLVVMVPDYLGNEIENVQSSLPFEFIMQEDGSISVPKTYDDSNIMINLLLMFVSLIIILVLVYKIIKMNKEKMKNNS